MDKPVVSIITPTYKRDQKILQRCLDSVKYQTMTSFEHIICSDGGFDPSTNYTIGMMQDPRFIYRYVPEHQNDYAWTIRKTMLKEAKGTYILYLDDDNYIAPTYLEKMLKPLSFFTETAFSICQIVHFGPLPTQWGRPPQVLSGLPPVLYNIDTLQVLAKKSALEQIDWGDNKGYFFEHVYEALGKKFKWAEVPEILGLHL